MKTFPRTRRIGEQIRRELAELIRDELRDSRLTLISMTSVEVSRDLAYARIYVTLVGDPTERAVGDGADDALGHHEGVLARRQPRRAPSERTGREAGLRMRGARVDHINVVAARLHGRDAGRHAHADRATPTTTSGRA